MSYFELSLSITIYDPLPSSTSKYSVAELADPDTGLRAIELHSSPSGIFTSVLDSEHHISVSLSCEFSGDEQFRGDDATFTGTVLRVEPSGIEAPSGLRPLLIKCALPKMEMQTRWLSVRMRLTQEPDVAVSEKLSAASSPDSGFASYSFLSLNAIKLRVLELPYLSSVRPLNLFNLATSTSVTVTGHDFEETGAAL
jgi:hypothetical protein